MADGDAKLSGEVLKALADLETQLADKIKTLGATAEKATKQSQEAGEVSKELKDELTKAATDMATVSERVEKFNERMAALEVETKKAAMSGGGERLSTLGVEVTKDEEFVKGLRDLESSNASRSIHIKKEILNQFPATVGQPLVQPDRQPGIMIDPNRRFTIRDLVPTGRTESNLVVWARELLFTNNAGPTVGGSPENVEGVLKPQSTITFELAETAVVTLAHWIYASRQVLSDAGMLRSHIDARLVYGLKLFEELEILNGPGGAGRLTGIIPASTAYNRAQAGDTKIDTLRRAMTQVQLSEFSATGVVLNPEDWEEIELTKVSGSDGRYIVGFPTSLLQPRMWGLPVVVTNSMPTGEFLVGAFDLSTMLWDRETVTVRASTEDRDNFVRNMVTILAEERLAMTVVRPAGVVSGAFSASA